MGNVFTLLLLTYLGFTSGVYSHNDIFVAVGDRIELLTSEGHSQLNLGRFNASALVALVFDPSSQQLFFSDARHSKGHIFSIDLGEQEDPRDPIIQDVVAKASKQSVESLTYDPVDNTLMWTDGYNQTIRRIRMDAAEPANFTGNASVEVIHFLSGDKPRGLVCDPCSRMLYWTNWNTERPTIERSHIDGTDRQVIVSTDLYMPHGLDLDLREQRIYWANNLRHGSFQIERSLLDGSERQVIYHGEAHKGKGQFIYGLTVGDDYIYWTDWDSKTLFAYPKGKSQNEPTALRHYPHRPMSVTIRQRHPINCQQLSTLSEIFQTETTAGLQVVEELTFSPVPVQLETEPICSGYCLNGGQCSFDDSEVNCSCPENFSGERCELFNDTTTSVAVDCVLPTTLIPTDTSLYVALVTLSVTCFVLLVSVMVLSIRVWQLSSGKYRPRLKRRRLARFSAKFDPQLPLPASGHVINIEDCCNMNICETPCTEPPTSTINSRTPSMEHGNKTRKDDRIKLLNCEF